MLVAVGLGALTFYAAGVGVQAINFAIPPEPIAIGQGQSPEVVRQLEAMREHLERTAPSRISPELILYPLISAGVALLGLQWFTGSLQAALTVLLAAYGALFGGQIARDLLGNVMADESVGLTFVVLTVVTTWLFTRVRLPGANVAASIGLGGAVWASTWMIPMLQAFPSWGYGTVKDFVSLLACVAVAWGYAAGVRGADSPSKGRG